MSRLWHEATGIWFSGGWAMIVLAVNACLLGWIGLNVKLRLMRADYHRISESRWRSWICDAADREGDVGELIGFALGAHSLSAMEAVFEEFRHIQISSLERELKIMRVCVATSPLLGLLGTVTGMLTTFGALAFGSGGEQTMNMIAGGISEALITTETGLVIALPGLLFVHHLAQEKERFEGFVASVESACAQELHKRLRDAAQARENGGSDAGVPTQSQSHDQKQADRQPAVRTSNPQEPVGDAMVGTRPERGLAT
jgi:biopolymer transport protein ExbB